MTISSVAQVSVDPSTSKALCVAPAKAKREEKSRDEEGNEEEKKRDEKRREEKKRAKRSDKRYYLICAIREKRE